MLSNRGRSSNVSFARVLTLHLPVSPDKSRCVKLDNPLYRFSTAPSFGKKSNLAVVNTNAFLKLRFKDLKGFLLKSISGGFGK
jgi:hypothetical protein